jgi:hypothetical protein
MGHDIRDTLKAYWTTADFCLLVSSLKTYKTIILPIVLYGWETLSLIQMEEHTLSMSEYKVLRIFGPKREEVSGGWRGLHNEELVTCTLHLFR